jgi:hypothetical protein
MTVSAEDELPPFVRHTGLPNWNRIAAVNDEFVPIHMDDRAGRDAGYPGAFGMGTMQWSYLHNVVRDWIGPAGRIISVACQFRQANTQDQTVVARGRVQTVDVRDGETLVDLEIWTESEDGERLAIGTATVALAP